MKKKGRKGFTLIELMIVVAIIGILAAIAIPRFARLVDKAREAASKGGLGALRSAVTIYYGKNEGVFVDSLAATYFLGTDIDDAIDKIPVITLNRTIHAASSITTEVGGAGTINDTVAWNYDTSGGTVLVDCTHTDLMNVAVHTW